MTTREVSLDRVYRILLTTKASDVPEDIEDAMTDDAWDLWARALYKYPNSIAPKTVLDSYIADIEDEEMGLY